MTDLITRLAGLARGSTEDRALANRAEARRHVEETYKLLLHPADPGPNSVVERRAVAAFVAVLHQQPETVDHYRALLDEMNSTLAQVVLLAAEAGQGPGPWGRYPPGPLSHEDRHGTPFRVADESRKVLGDRLAAALNHAHLLTLHPQDASQAALQALLDAGWTTPGIVTLSQLVAFLSLQIRVVAGLRALHAARAVIPA